MRWNTCTRMFRLANGPLVTTAGTASVIGSPMSCNQPPGKMSDRLIYGQKTGETLCPGKAAHVGVTFKRTADHAQGVEAFMGNNTMFGENRIEGWRGVSL